MGPEMGRRSREGEEGGVVYFLSFFFFWVGWFSYEVVVVLFMVAYSTI